MNLPPYHIIEKYVGETPLEAMEAWRARMGPAYASVPLAYAGRLDPLASGKLLILIGEERKRQEAYHALDKEYEFSILVGVQSDTGDVMGRLTTSVPFTPSREAITQVTKNVPGKHSFPYPAFSSKTVSGTPLHTWAASGRLHEIEIPRYEAIIYRLQFTRLEEKTRSIIYEEALAKINSIPPVTDTRKALGNDFRRPNIREDWRQFLEAGEKNDTFTILHFSGIVKSGTYIRSLAPFLGDRLGGTALAYHIHRATIGRYQPIGRRWGWWRKRYR